jgi:cytochrome oxidase Cu insertion factor (SCO1/SenC/PrrC family)
MHYLTAAILFALFVSTSSRATYSASPPNDVKIQDVRFVNELGQETSISEMLSTDKGLILVPAYYSCNSTCPLTAGNLKKAILGSPHGRSWKVLFLSFDPTDSVKGMAMFRHHHDLPPEWGMGVLQDEGVAKEFLAKFFYTFQKTATGFDHPNAAFVFSPGGTIWTGSLFGIDNTSSEVERAYSAAILPDERGLWAGFRKIFEKQEYVLAIGVIGTVLPLVLIGWLLARRSTPDRKTMSG